MVAEEGFRASGGNDGSVFRVWVSGASWLADADMVACELSALPTNAGGTFSSSKALVLGLHVHKHYLRCKAYQQDLRWAV